MKVSRQGRGEENCFMGMDYGEHAHIVILPVPFDKTLSYESGSHKGPIALVNASRNIEFFDLETYTFPYRDDVHTAQPVKSGESFDMIEKVYAECKRLLQRGKFIVTLGGENTISIGAIKAHAEHFGSLSILQIYAHTDLVDEYEDNKYSHACVMKRVKEPDNIANVVALGIRSMAEEEKNKLEKSEVFFAHELVRDEWILDVVELCPVEGFHAPDYTAAKIVFKALAYKYTKGEK